MNAVQEVRVPLPWPVGWRRRGAALLAFVLGVWAGLATLWGLTSGWHFALNVSSAAWGSIVAFGTGVGLIFSISAPPSFPSERRLASSALLSGVLLVAGSQALGFAIRAIYPDFESSVHSTWFSALGAVYWLAAPWLLARLTGRIFQPKL
jgi:hypothetical protein